MSVKPQRERGIGVAIIVTIGSSSTLPSISSPPKIRVAIIVAARSSSAAPSRSSPPKTDPPKTDLILDPPKTELVLDTLILFSLLLNVADLAATNNQPTPLHPQTHSIWPPPSSIHSNLSLSRSIYLSLNLSLFLLPLAQCLYFDFWLG